MIALILSFCFIYLVTLTFIFNLFKEQQRERQLLLDRIQARDIQEFKAYTEPEPVTVQEDKPDPIEFI